MNFSWLQISDLHIVKSTSWNIMKKGYETIGKNYKINFIIVTGDLHDFQTNYEETTSFLEELLSIFHLKKSDIFIVPGNHDSENFKTKVALTNYINTHIEENSDIYLECNESLQKAFTKYNEFISNFYLDENPYNSSSEISICKWNNQINLIHLNTALISDGTEHLQIIDINKLSENGHLIDKSLPSIILAHHDFLSLYESHRILLSQLLKNYKIDAYLCGDKHKLSKNYIDKYDCTQLGTPCIVCGKSAIKPLDNYSDFGCIIYSYNANEQTVYVEPKKWEPKRNRFEPDHSLDNDDGTQFHFKTHHISSPNKKHTPAKQPKEKKLESIWLPDAEVANGEQSRFKTFTPTPHVESFLDKNSNKLGIAAVKGIGKTFLLQLKKAQIPRDTLCIPVGIRPSKDNNWATEKIVLDDIQNLNKLQKFNELVLVWKYSTLCYVINQCVNYKDNIQLNNKHKTASPESVDAINKLKLFLSELPLQPESLSYCTEINYSSLNIILTDIITGDDISKLVSEYHILLRANYYISSFLKSIHKKKIAVFIDKVDQSILQTSAEPPVECTQCHKQHEIINCTNPKKGTEFCSTKDAKCKMFCCYGCENFFGSYSNTPLRRYHESIFQYRHISLWQHIQLSLVLAVSQIKTELSGNIDVYYTIRQEAFAAETNILGGENSKKVTALTEELWYTYDDQKKIFYDCIRHQDQNFLYDASLKNNNDQLDAAFVGIQHLCHPYVDGQAESLFECLYRHSFDRTRDLQEYGQVLTNNLERIKKETILQKREELIKSIIENAAAEFAYTNNKSVNSANPCYYYEKIDFLPNYWANPQNFENLLKRIDRNLLFDVDIIKICQEINNKKCNGNCKQQNCSHHPFSMLYRLGLLGRIMINTSNENDEKQEFLHSKAITYIQEEDELHIASDGLHMASDVLYLLHPALSKSIEKTFNKQILHFKGFIIGKNREVPSRLLEEILKAHDDLSEDDFIKTYYGKNKNVH